MNVVGRGAGMTDGLEIVSENNKFILVDKSPDGRFAVDVDTWNKEAVGKIKSKRIPKSKKQDAAK
jgi:hypothetical protein